ncbi:MAG: FAD-dependent oxidoreductase [Coriobacteriaceae bacterium]|nr:FAD-dependent oxidoreductase [Coriobacteriaceae bacterium]
MILEEATTSRRGFVGAAAAAAAALAVSATGCAAAPKSESSKAASSAAGSNAGTGETLLPNLENLEFHKPTAAPVAFVDGQIADGDIKETIECDVVVCGAGMAGATAAASCSQHGLATVLLEKGATFAARGSEIGAIDDRAHKAAGVEIDKKKLLDDAMVSADYRADRNVWKRYIDRSGEAMDWAIDTSEATPGSKCGDFTVVGANTESDGVITWASGVRVAGGTPAFVEMMIENAKSHGADVRYNTPACQLVRDGEGAVTGVIAKADGSYIKFNAKKGVVLATGSYDQNWDILSQVARPRDLAVNAWINPTLTEAGDGHLMGQAVGAAIDDLPHVLMNDPAGSTAGTRANGAIFAFPRVNAEGKRFVNESLSFEFVTNSIMYQTGARDYLLMSGDLEAAFDTMKGVIPWKGSDLVAQCKDVLIEANSIDELAEKIGVDKDALKATVERYNEFCAKGVDEDFGKNPTTLLPLDQAPFYALEESGSCLVTVSGLKINEKSQVLDTKGAAIEGLYALGNTSGSMFFGTYPHHISAVSHGRCVCFGYLVGRTLAGLE